MDKDTLDFLRHEADLADTIGMPECAESFRDAIAEIERLTGILEHVGATARLHAESDWEREQQTEGEG